jgi:hypothetical protein
MTVLLNKWDGKQFESDSCCDWCGKFASVKIISVKCIALVIDQHLRKVCKSCLLTWTKEIDQAVLKAASKGEPDAPKLG